MNLDDNELINTIKKQNKIDVVNIRIVKRTVKEKKKSIRKKKKRRRINNNGSR